jgi:hypothetical protein
VSSEAATILANAQNPFDNWFGDICGVARHRYFLIEFKRNRSGFLEEVKRGSAKPHRTALSKHLRNDEVCRKIARFGHFDAYQDNAGLLAFEPYAHSVAPRIPAKELIEAVLSSSVSAFELDYPAWIFNFGQFYNALHESDLSLHYQSPPWLFKSGLGIPEADLEQYVLCMYSHLEYFEVEDGVILLAALDPSTNELSTIPLPPFQMVTVLKEKFEGLRLAMADGELCSNRTKLSQAKTGQSPS